MEIKEFKKHLVEDTLTTNFVIFKYVDNDFIAKQYTNKIASILNREILYIDDIKPLLKKPMFYAPSPYLTVYKCDELETLPKITDNLVIITKKCPDNDHVVDIPKLDDWQIKDYVYSVCEGCPESSLDYLIDACKKDIYRLDKEVHKISEFTKDERKYMCQDMFSNNVWPRLNDETIFDFTTALLSKNTLVLRDIYENITNLDIEPLGVVTILYKNVKNMLLVGFQANPTPENTGLTAKQIWGVKQSMKAQKGDTLLSIFKIVSEIDMKLKNGELPADMILDYTVLKVLSL